MARGERLDIFQRGVDLLRERTICGDILLVVFIEAWERNGQEVFVVLVAELEKRHAFILKLIADVVALLQAETKTGKSL